MDSNTINAIAAYSTLALVLLTAIYVVLTYFVLRAGSRPYVSVSVEERGQDAYLYIKNTGKTAAFDVEIVSTPHLNELQYAWPEDYKLDPFLRHSYLPPDFKASVLLASAMYIVDFEKQRQKPPRFEVAISYKEKLSFGIKWRHKEHYTLDVGALIYNKLYEPDRVKEALQKAVDSIEKIERSIKQIATNTGPINRM